MGKQLLPTMANEINDAYSDHELSVKKDTILHRNLFGRVKSESLKQSVSQNPNESNNVANARNHRLHYLEFIGSAINFFILEFKLSRKKVAEDAGIGESYLSYIISNKKEATIKTLFKIAFALNDIPVEFILMKAKQIANELKNESKTNEEKIVASLYSELESLYISLNNRLENK